MEGGDPDAPTHHRSQKRPRLDSVNPPPLPAPPPPGVQYSNRLPPPPRPQHPSSAPAGEAASPSAPPTYPQHTLPQPDSYSPRTYPGGVGPLPSPAFDIRVDPRTAQTRANQAPDHGPNHPPIGPPVARSVYPAEHPPIYTAPQNGSSHASTAQDVKRHSVALTTSPMEANGLSSHATGMYVPPVDPRQNGHVPNGSVPNGYPGPVVGAQHAEQYPPPAMAPGQHYAPPVPQFSQPGTPYMGPTPQFQGQMRRKQVRAQQACNNCRARKQKCDEQRPCQFCKDQNIECLYKDVPPPKQDRTMLALQDSVNNVASSVDNITDILKAIIARLDSVESRLPSTSAASDSTYHQASPALSSEQGQRMRSSIAESDVIGSRIATPLQHRQAQVKSEPPNFFPQPSPIVKAEVMQHPIAPEPATPAESERHVQAPNEGDDSPREPKVGLLGDHTTPAHQLLADWRSMSQFYAGTALLNLDSVSQYPMIMEQRRGLLRLWGVGQGGDENDGAQGPASPESTTSDAPSPAREGLWGKGYATPPTDEPSPATPTSSFDGHYRDHPGGLNPDGSLKLDAETIRRLQSSYFENIHILHPFIDKGRLQKNITKFIELYSPENRVVFSPGSAVPTHVRGTGLKRKRSTSHYDGYSPGDFANPRRIERSVGNAIILLVLALGKVCEYKQPLPGPTGDPPESLLVDPYSKGSPHSSFNSASYGEEPPKKNVDVLPGLAYFAHATDILGNQQGGNSIAHAQALLLAGLYYGQYARVLESWSLIHSACRACSILIRNDLDKISKKTALQQAEEQRRMQALGNKSQPTKEEVNEMYRLNLLKCVYWTCLQLESDILAEMSTLPPSGISKFQDDIAYPSGVSDEMPSADNLPDDITTSMLYYSAQIHLRVLLNNAHNSLYRQKLDPKDVRQVSSAAMFLNDNLKYWRAMLPSKLQWRDNDPPATDINAARLRAKYYGGQYMILRPFLYLSIHELEFPPGAPRSVVSSQNNSPAATNIIPEQVERPHSTEPKFVNLVNLDSDQKLVLTIAQQCIDSAVQSTIAFDRVGAARESPYSRYNDIAPQRLIVTNIFGTLHAQFGNMLVLAAVYRTRLQQLHHLKLKHSTVDMLLRRTIRVLEQVAPNSPVLEMDVKILKKIKGILSEPKAHAELTPRVVAASLNHM
ncbi:hypothetical protein GQ43DRAFT_229181 [Delitschia confertaspora ATCC 74209]|uniref:Zn(2)-C6 fungal-type domain-containing protein n=1 Tax=Delitschia confertaspora ATCC 74209 TaxID=1513339 RepID=A0A9P4MSA0_9PLEO|nr:hypothetical protein GQ43DRAFT_229181 [Delitschia confertaspora ATCC 74209]